MKTIFLFLSLSAFLAPACTEGENQIQEPETKGNLKYIEAFPNLKFKRPVDFQSPKDGSNRAFVVEQEGLISVFENKRNVKSRNTFLDISGAVDDKGNEEGLLGLAFHPNFKENGYFYVNYTVSSSETLISRFSVDKKDPNKADASSELVLLRYAQPYNNHNGGQVAFGPDGFLYISVGDGGSGGDPKENGQNPGSLLGSILRIDVDSPQNGNNYGIPADNPFVQDKNARPEIYAFGLRNPWRISFDSSTGRLWCGDVGQNKFEEIDIIEKGKNYGWNEMEGLHTYENGSNSEGFTAPVLEIPQSTGDKSITGGYAYRGKKAGSLFGKYIFADYVSGRIYALSETDGGSFSNQTLFDTDLNIAAFGTDENHELYFCAFDGKIYTFEE
ncbi:PQQ-dependent sugar dehydrogenase [Marinilongibacter aquaticus]|uniref:PQQ-dependent sugar dehydrogenase n=1 Tax=Marinilongibacter aquaticus TaxID=2975157 RepID=UPI0021BD24E0|nr:PQQ-dependent sugar dehydrogenase [Marinilongibacter aquaticus]UBM57517.1 PQQ-dependent sugar dehydrogenase [Marinilongibacter aquaticus]